jgi:hypothetical protein
MTAAPRLVPRGAPDAGGDAERHEHETLNPRGAKEVFCLENVMFSAAREREAYSKGRYAEKIQDKSRKNSIVLNSISTIQRISEF